MITPPRLLLVTLAACVCTAPAFAVEDLAPIDPKPLLEALRGLKDQQTASVKQNKQRFIQEAIAAASNPARAAELWEDAIRATQFQGVTKENAQFKEWKEKDGDALKSREVATALHLYFNWLALTLQRSAGAEVKALLPAVLNHVHEVAADVAAMDAFDEAMKKEKEAPGSVKRPTSVRDKEKRQDDQAVKRMHDQIVRQSLGGSPFVQWMRISEFLNDAGPQRPRGGKGGGRPENARPEESGGTWEQTPGSYDGIFTSILLPEMRANKDLRLLEYWDTKLRREAEQVTATQRTFELEKFNKVRRPQLLWSRSTDMAKVGQRNRAITEMFKQIKEFPAHPDAGVWITELESMLAPPPPAPAPEVQPAPASTLPGAQ